MIKSGLNPQKMTMTMHKDFDQAQELGSFGVLRVHSQSFSPNNPVALSIIEFIDHIKSSQQITWITTGSIIDSWWRERALFKSMITGTTSTMLLNVKIKPPGLHWNTALARIFHEDAKQATVTPQ